VSVVGLHGLLACLLQFRFKDAKLSGYYNKTDSLMCIIDKLTPTGECNLIAKKYSPNNWQTFMNVSHKGRSPASLLSLMIFTE